MHLQSLRKNTPTYSGAGTNLKLGGTHPSILVVVLLHVFGSTSTIGRFGECFHNGQYSLVSFLFADLLMVPPVPNHLYKSGGGARVPILVESVPLPT